MPRRIDLGRAVLFAGAALLFVSLFVEWYDTGPTGWQVFESLDLVLAGLAVAGAFAALRPDATPLWAAAAVPGAALVIVLVQLIDAPPAAGDGDPATGAWLALAGAFLMAAGSALSLAAISVTLHVGERDVRRRVPAVDRRGRGDEADLADEPDRDVDAGGASTRDRPPASLFSSLGLGGGGAREGAPAPPDEARTVADAPAARGAEAADLERTQPLTEPLASGDDVAGRPRPREEDAGRP